MKKTVLDNGLTIITEENKTLKSVTLGFIAKVGSFHEMNYPAGIAHFVEHLLFKGTKTRTSEQIGEQLSFIGADFNAYTTFDHTKYFFKVAFDQWKEGYDIMSDMVWNSTFPAEEVNRERNVIFEEIKMYEDKPSSVAIETMESLIFTHNPNRKNIIGYKETVETITRGDIINFVNEFYVPNNIVIVAAGNLSHNELVEYVKSSEVTRNAKEVKPVLPFSDKWVEEREKQIHREISQAHLVLSLKAPSITHEDQTAFSILASILGEGMSSRLFKEIRERLGLVYTVSAFKRTFKDTGNLFIYAGLDEKNIEKTINIVKEQMQLLKTELVGEYELQMNINQIRGQFMTSLEQSNDINRYIAKFEVQDRGYESPEEVIERYKKITAEQVREVANKYFNTDNLFKVTVVPSKKM